jgi:peptide/nickel transport system ATP-binding protein
LVLNKIRLKDIMAKDSEAILKLNYIVKKYKTKGTFFGAQSKDIIALNNISLKISKGEIFGLVGESGSGKTTVGRLIVKLERPEKGEIYLDGQEILSLKGDKLKEFTRKVQMIFQDPYQSLNPHLSVLDAVSEPLIIHKIGNNHAREKIAYEAIRSVGLSPPEDFINRYPHQLSGGQRQRVAIARAMILKPEIVIADEPTSMLDASISAQIFNILLQMREKSNITFLFITHSLAAARYLCDRIAVIYKGNLMEIGPAEEILHNPKHPYTQSLIDALPKLDLSSTKKRYNSLLRVERIVTENTGCPFFSRCNVSDEKECGQNIPPMKDLGKSHSAACFYV